MTRRLDESMNLLNIVREDALDPAYRAASRPVSAWTKTASVVLVLLAGVMIAISASQSVRTEPQNAQERADLIKRIMDLREEQTHLRADLAALDVETKSLGQKLVADPQAKSQLETLETVAGTRAVTGPGITITVDDAPNATQPSQVVTDRDLRKLVNGLWRAGAETISINGHRLSSRTAIRSAGSAITVDYSSLVRPYVVEAIGDPKSLAGKFGQTSGASWWNSLRSNYGLRFEVGQSNQIEMAADPGLGLSKATSVEEKR